MKGQKKFTKIIAVAVVIAIVLAMPHKLVKRAMATSATFNGISGIISSSTVDKPFTVFELVPDKKMAKFGYLVKGEEPENYEAKLSTLATKTEREEYMKTLLEKLAPIMDGQGQKPLTSLGKYEEVYSLDGVEESKRSQYREITLATPSVLEKDASGMKVVPKEGGSFSVEVSYIPKKGGGYEENIKNFVYNQDQRGRYSVIFTKAGEDVFSKSEFLYKPSEIVPIDDDAIVPALSPNLCIYRRAKPVPGDTEEEKKKISYEYAFTTGSTTTEDKRLDFDNYEYASIKFAPVVTREISAEDRGSGVYYVVGEKTYLGSEAEYDAVLDDADPYKKVSDGTGDFEQHRGDSYVYVGVGRGTYELVFEKDAVLDHNLTITKIFYKGAYKNNDWFRNTVFLKSDDANNSTLMPIDVRVVTPQELDEYVAANRNSALGIDLLYISTSSATEKSPASYSNSIDISSDTKDFLIEATKRQGVKLPVVVEGIGSTSYQGELKKLVTELVSNSNTRLEQYVKKNIYVVKADRTDTPYFLNDFTKTIVEDSNVNTFVTKATDKGFGEVATSIRDENSIIDKGIAGTTDNTVKFEQKITRAVVLEYIISYAHRRIRTTDGVIKVLEIEPARPWTNGDFNSFDPKKKMKDRMVKLFGKYGIKADSLDITRVTTAEFIGRTEEISDYDLVYIGTETDGMNTSGTNRDNTPRTVYNDSAMDGLIYSNVGDIVVTKNVWAKDGSGSFNSKGGLFDTDYNQRSWVHNNWYMNDEAYKDPVENSSGIKTYYNTSIRSQDDYTRAKSGKANDYELNFEVRDINSNKNYANTYRFSGNDITKEKLKKLKNYIDAGYPIIFGAGFFDNSVSTVNEEKIDNSSNMYELAKFAISYRNNNAVRGNVVAEDLFGNLKEKDILSIFDNINLPKPSVRVIEGDRLTDPTGKETPYAEAVNNSLEVNFFLSNKGFSTDSIGFEVSLYIDRNADGKFSETQEVISSDMYDVSMGGKVIKGEISPNENVPYKLTYKLPPSYIGVIPYKIKIAQSGSADKRYTSYSGYTYVKNVGEKQVVNVLQIMTDPYPAAGKYVYNRHFKRFDWPTNTTFNMQERLGNTGSKFSKLVSEVTDFDIRVKSITATEFAKEYKHFKDIFPYSRPVEFFDFGDNHYDMLVLGFADVYNITNMNNSLEAIQGFINAGKPVLFTHDTTSFINYRRNSPWGYDFNRMIRSQVGLDRYGVLSNWALRVGATVGKSDRRTWYNRRTYPTVERNSSRDVNASDLFREIQTKAIKQNKDIAYEPKSNKSVIVRHSQGITYAALLRNSNDPKNKYTYKGLTDYTLNGTTNKVERINSGQITTYPYVIGEEIEVADTHMQPYQLDMNEDLDEDGESDLIVWYTLKGKENPRNDSYHASPRDVRNNYYIYTKGNITYSGVGHSAAEKEEELKLYINTMIAAYKSAAQPPTVKFLDSGNENAKEKRVSYIAYDVVNNKNLGAIDSSTQKVYFTVDDDNALLKNIVKEETKILAKFVKRNYIRGAASTPENNDNPIKFEEIPIKYNTFKASDGSRINYQRDSKEGEVLVLDKGGIYYFEVPSSEYENLNKLDITIVAKSRFRKENKNTSIVEYDYSSQQKANYTIQKIGLFDLD